MIPFGVCVFGRLGVGWGAVHSTLMEPKEHASNSQISYWSKSSNITIIPEEPKLLIVPGWHIPKLLFISLKWNCWCMIVFITLMWKLVKYVICLVPCKFLLWDKLSCIYIIRLYYICLILFNQNLQSNYDLKLSSKYSRAIPGSSLHDCFMRCSILLSKKI